MESCSTCVGTKKLRGRVKWNESFFRYFVPLTRSTYL